MVKRKNLLAIVILLYALPARSGEPCRADELIGRWDLTSLNVIRPGLPYGASPLAYRFQRRIFGRDGTSRHLVSDRKITPAKERELLKFPPVRFHLTDESWVVVTRDDEKRTELDRFRCRKISKREIELTWVRDGESAVIQKFSKDPAR